ncbi:MAG: low specificity L-threonine aldolase [Lacunisphaera sp.]|nr:low specificity L-threonine aldolase [Lacunisphaera sp.]
MSAPPRPVRHDYTFASDNSAGLAPEALAALIAANPGGAPSYGEDEWTARAKKLLGGIFATECEVFLVFNGTAANALPLAHFCRSHHSIICHEVSHVDTDECGAPEFFTGGSKVIALPGASGKLQPADLEPVFRRGHGVHYPKAGALSLTQSTEWGTVYTPDEVRALCAEAKKHGLAVHMDGARFANAASTLSTRGCSPADFTWRAGVDVLSFGGTKNGMNTTEAVVFFNPEHAREFEYRVKQGGQLASKMRFAAAQWIGMLETGAWLRHAAHANAMAQKLAAALRGLPGVKFAAEPESNGVFLLLPVAAAEALWARGWHFYLYQISRNPVYRLMCSWATTPDAIDRFVAELRSVLG